jgi:decaprenyl-phosphate phosphoribosyltransferase
MSGKFALILVVYWLINLLYSAELKHRFILGLFATSSGLVLRMLGGAIAIQADINHWLLIYTMCLALLLAFGKRRRELVLSGLRPAS